MQLAPLHGLPPISALFPPPPHAPTDPALAAMPLPLALYTQAPAAPPPPPPPMALERLMHEIPPQHRAAVLADPRLALLHRNAHMMLAFVNEMAPRGLRPDVLDELTFTQTLTTSEAEFFTERGPCAICLDTYEQCQVIRRLPCLCVFHGPCIERHLEESTKCPLCRRDVRAVE
jgi:hypothetical protein